MQIRPWGTRGSIPSPGPSTTRYGGNTSCVEVRLHDDRLVIIDAGTGIRPLGASLGVCDATLLFSHYHWDHIQGFPFFTPAFLHESNIEIYGPQYGGEGPEEILFRQMHSPYFPADPSQLRGIRACHATPAHSFRLGGATVRAARASHPSVTYGYRIEDDGAAFVYFSDNEVDIAPAEILEGIIGLAEGADLLLHDCQYFEPEYHVRQGWGHSTPRQVLQVARAAGVRRVMLFHHDPSHSDEQVEALAEEARGMAGEIEILISREGEGVVVGEDAAVNRSLDAL
jgi:phosphoribosyl 1,2-cyclic phosphodiesterase